MFRGCHGRDRIMIVVFTTTYAISAYPDQFKFHSGGVYSIQHYVIKFDGDLRQMGGFLQALLFLPPNKTDNHDIAEILLKVALNTIILILKQWSSKCLYLYLINFKKLLSKN